MKTIWKYPAAFGHFVRDLPKGAHVLAIQAQGDHPQMWALVDQEATEAESREFLVVGTGKAYESKFWNDLNYIGTFQMEDGALIWHAFERRVQK